MHGKACHLHEGDPSCACDRAGDSRQTIPSGMPFRYKSVRNAEVSMCFYLTL